MYVPNLIVYISFISVVKEKVLGGLTIVWLFHPDDIKTLFENEGKYPSRRSHLALEKYRKEKPEFYNNGGLLPTNGYEWARMRKAAQKPLTKQLLSNHIQVIIYLLGAIHKRRRQLGGVNNWSNFPTDSTEKLPTWGREVLKIRKNANIVYGWSPV